MMVGQRKYARSLTPRAPGSLFDRWQRLVDRERRTVLCRSATTLGVVASAFIALPMLPAHYQAQQEAAAYRADIRAFAAAEDAGALVRAEPAASPLLDHAWLRTVEYSLDRAPQAILGKYAERDRDTGALETLSIAPPAALIDQAEATSINHKCLAEAVYYEARSESLSGQLAVAEVVLNRVADQRFPNSVCEVVYQGAERRTGCQFTFTCDGATARKPRGVRWQRAQTVAAHALLGLAEPRTHGATHYHATYVDPIWNVGLIRTDKIDTHIFYRFPRGAEWAKVRNAVARKRAARNRLLQTISAPASETDATKLAVISPAP